MDFNVNELLNSLSYTLDYVEKDLISDVTNHGRRVAYIAARIGQKIRLSNTELFDLISYSLLHDNGVTKSLIQMPDPGNYQKAELSRMHCVEGEKNIVFFPFFHKVPNVILYHHEHYDGSGFFGISGKKIPMFSRIIALADSIAICFSEGKKKADIEIWIKRACIFDRDFVDVFLELSRNIEFWLNMDDNFVFQALRAIMPSFHRESSYQEMHTVSSIFSNIIDAKSPFTGSHSRGISEKTGILCDYYQFDRDTYWKMRIAADLHDLGKLMVPNEILDKPGTLTPSEIAVIQSHTFYTRKTLEGITGFEEIADWAANHHEKLNGKGYPYGFDADRLDFNSRLLGCVDIYQALTEDRPYRPPMSHRKAIALMRNMAGQNLIDSSIVEDINRVFESACATA
ncbi:HD-GYP domain-containing protein [Caproiciproducens faecalis]|uniref:HD domain-containing protein n=1 Tax=Caproiciproducens faecalis TaxID=2820301 RepID=A0ABS7DQQ9_9FIRM|nr:HD domain-containing phosphohydrolase [Caproiciproducens faecalis]MBW7573626.1 HD domain-containing protein [Caproiciproducens faecalis]